MGQLRQQLARELRRRRGDTTHRDFARQLGISKSSLHRIEMGEQNVGLDLLEHLCTRLHCTIGELFPPDPLPQT
jgi:transcriptional regulator with XRE-family HTH domain